VGTEWDRHTEQSLASLRDELVRSQIRDSIAPYSPLWQRWFDELEVDPRLLLSVEDLTRLPAMGERDVSVNGDPASALVLQIADAGHSQAGAEGRLARRLQRTQPETYRRQVDADTRSTSYVFTGLGIRFPVASTRGDLDLIAEAGRRLWQVLGLTREDVLVCAVPPAATTEHVALQAAALAAGTPAMFPGDDLEQLVAAVHLAPPSVLAMPSETAAELLAGLSGLDSVRTLLLVGAPTDAERLAAERALLSAGAEPGAVALAVHAPTGARVLWGECRRSSGTTGFHTYPDLDVVQVIDPETGADTDGPGELVLTQLRLRGSALLRWRTGDATSGVTTAVCPECRRLVARVEGVRRAALVARLGSGQVLDLRPIAMALSERADVRDWRLVVGPRSRDGAITAVVHLSAVDPDDASIVIDVASDLRDVAGTPPTQLVAADLNELVALGGSPLSTRILRQ
jgi:phenylacetate-coenzyme A ligase PaaK-like adenylate-forming protein